MDTAASPQPPSASMAMAPPQALIPTAADADEARRVSELKAFASHLGSSTVPSAGSSASLSRPELARHLHRDDSDPTGGAICSLPGLDLNAGEDADGADGGEGGGGGGGGTSAGAAPSGLLPSVGASHQQQQQQQQHPQAANRSDSTDAMPPPPPQAPHGGGASGLPGSASAPAGVAIPAMAASVFATNSTADAVTQANTAQNSVPTVGGMSAPNPDGTVSAGGSAAASASASSDAATQSPEAASANAAKLEQAASRNLGTRTTWTRSSVSQAPHAMLRSLSSSFSSLVDSRVRAWTLLLLRHSLSSGDDASRSRLLTLLATSSSMDLTAVALKFQCLDLPPEMKAKMAEEKRLKAAARAAGMAPEKDTERECDVVLPLIFEAKIDVTIQGQNVSVALRAPGTIAADFAPTSGLIKYLEVKLDTNALVACMVEQARLVVFKAVARATALPSTASGLSKHLGATSLTSSSSSSGGPLAGFNSALSLGGKGMGGSAKATASAQRLQDLVVKKLDPNAKSIGGGDHGATPGKVRKNRSVTWNTQLDAPKSDSSNWPQAKRRKVSTPQPMMKRSNKSFGKPDPDDFESVRNATFAEFGHAHKHSNVPTFVNGRLQVPNPNQQSPGGLTGGGGGMGMAGRSMGNLGNATFNFNSRGGGGGGGGGGGQNSFFNLQRRTTPSYSELARTATYSTQPPHRHGLQRTGSTEMAGMTRRGSSEGMGGLTRTPTQLENMLLNATGTQSRNTNSGANSFGLRRS